VVPVPFPSAASVARSAFRAGSLVGFLFRSSVHAPSGVVLVCSFGRPGPAAAFARRWAGRAGVSVPVRRSWGRFDVSVPVAREGCRHPASAGLVCWVSGGVVGFHLALQSSGFRGWRVGRGASRAQ
jgi:hypothetical protein